MTVHNNAYIEYNITHHKNSIFWAFVFVFVFLIENDNNN